MRKTSPLFVMVALVSGAANADDVTFTWVPFNNGAATNNGVCAPAACPAVGTLTLSSPQIDSSWAELVGATTDAPGVRMVGGSAGNYTGTSAIQAAGLSALSFSWNNLPNSATLALGSTLGNVQVGGGGWTAQFSSIAGAYILYNTLQLNGAGAAGQGLQVATTATTGAASMTNANYSLFGLQDYGYWQLSSYAPAVPVPAAAWLMLSGLAGFAAARRRKAAQAILS